MDVLPYALRLAPWSAGRPVRRRASETAAAAAQTVRLRGRPEVEPREVRVRELHDVVAPAVPPTVVPGLVSP